MSKVQDYFETICIHDLAFKRYFKSVLQNCDSKEIRDKLFFNYFNCNETATAI